jgi:hypothetical protein
LVVGSSPTGPTNSIKDLQSGVVLHQRCRNHSVTVDSFSGNTHRMLDSPALTD